MINEDFAIDPILLAEFLDESLYALSAVTSQVVSIEGRSDDTEQINAIFRPVHSMKGSAAFFGLFKTRELAHELETVLDHIRNGQLAPTADAVSVLLKGFDELSAVLSRVQNSDPEVCDDDAYNAVMDAVRNLAAQDHSGVGKLWATVRNLMAELRHAPVLQGTSELDRLNEAIAVFEELDARSNNIGSLPSSPALDDLVALLGELTGILNKPFDGTLGDADSARVLELFKAVAEAVENDDCRRLAEAAIADYDAMVPLLGFEPLLAEVLLDKVQLIRDGLSAAAPVKESDRDAMDSSESDNDPTDSPASPTGNIATNDSIPAERQKIMRVSEETIDGFLSHVGELIVVREMFEHLRRRVEELELAHTVVSELRRLTETFSSISRDLERSVMSIRKQSVRGLLQKVPRIVRDIAVAAEKEIQVRTFGDDVLIDKSLVETLEEPLVHMIRNAADHGIEPPDIREAAGKARVGTIEVKIEEEDEEIVTTIVDDGKGLDLVAIRNKAVSLGLVGEHGEMSEKDLIDCLFCSGVSTAETITDISGRGVGMDVVKRKIDACGGSIAVHTNQGAGTVFCLRLPRSVTTQILNGFIVSVNDTCYVLPINKVIESFPTSPDILGRTYGNDLYIKRHGSMIPVISIGQLFTPAVNGERSTAVSGILVVVEDNGHKAAMLVDTLVGIQQVVLKKMTGLQMKTEVFCGAALMGDGSVSLIIDIDKLMAFAGEAA